MRSLVGTGEIDIKPLVTHTYRLDEANEAFLAVENGEVGKVLFFPTVKKDIVLPLEFRPASTNFELPTMYEQPPYSQRVNEIIITGNEKKLDLLKKELDDLYLTADKLQRMISASRRSSLSPTSKISKSDLEKRLSEYEETRAEILSKSDKVEKQIRQISEDIRVNQN